MSIRLEALENVKQVNVHEVLIVNKSMYIVHT